MLSRLAFLAALVLSGCSSSTLEVSEARIRELVPGRNTTAAYFTVHNHSSSTMTLTGAISSRARAIEMHTMRELDGRLRMQPLEPIAIAPGERVVFAPGGNHLMVFGIDSVTDATPITLLFDDEIQIDVSFSKLPL